MPTDNYAIDEQGLTVFYPDDRYRYFDEKNGAVQFAWYELAAYIGENSPVYALVHKEQSAEELKAAVAEGRLPGARWNPFRWGKSWAMCWRGIRC